MTNQPAQTGVSIETKLYEFEYIQLAILVENGNRYMAIAIPDLITSKGWPMLMVDLTDDAWASYTARDRDLRSVFAEASEMRLVDLDAEPAVSTPVSLTEEQIRQFLPTAGFWHDVITSEPMAPGSTEARRHAAAPADAPSIIS